MTHPTPPSGRRSSTDSRARLVLTLLLVAAALLACGSCGYYGRTTYVPTVTLTNAPASALNLAILILPAGEKVQIQAALTVAANNLNNLVILHNGQKLTCNGVEFPTLRPVIQLSPQPPGGAYTFVYTDERGQQTKFVVPVGSTPPKILSPHAGDIVPIPTSKAGLIGTPATTPTSSTRPPDLVASLVVQYILPEFPVGSDITSFAEAGWAIPNCASSEKRHTVQCEHEWGTIDTGTSESNDTGAAKTKTTTFSDLDYPLGAGFEAFQPGPGWIGLNYSIHWTPTDSGFAYTHLDMQQMIEFPITWVRS